MATYPSYATTPVTWAGLVPGTLDTSLTAPTNVTTLGTAAATGTKIEEVTVQAVGTTTGGILNVFVHDGSTYHLWDQIAIPIRTSSTTSEAYRSSRSYSNLILPNASWSLRIAQTIAGNQSMLKVIATGASF